MARIILVLLFFVFANIFLNAQNQNTEFVENRNRIAFEFYKEYLSEEKNQVISPFFMNLSLSEIYLATKGGTASQIGDYMMFDSDKDKHLNNFINFQKIISENNSLNTNFVFSVDFFIEDTLKVLKSYNEKISKYLVDTVKYIDFTASIDSIVAKINSIIEKKSEGYFVPYLSAVDIPENPNIILNSACYFSGFWAKNFENTFTSSFKLDSDGKEIKHIKYFTSFDYFKYGETEEYQIIELPYEGYQLSLIVILPRDIYDLKNFEQIFNFDSYLLWRQKNMQTEKVRLLIPEFSVESFFNYKSNIDTIIPAIFTKGGNFLNLIRKVVFVNGLYHYAKFVVTDEGNEIDELEKLDFNTEMTENESFIFNANKPFIFLLIHRQSEAIIFMGHIYSPGIN
ncbi:MAG: serpin family protein [Bacteroidales bacterium]|nr:serpin family protein [Bacteroidales bacterium]